MPQSTQNFAPDPYNDAYDPRLDLSSLSDENDLDQTTSSLEYLVESDPEIPESLSFQRSPRLSVRLPAVRNSLLALYVDDTSSGVVGDDDSRGDSTASTVPGLTSGVSGLSVLSGAFERTDPVLGPGDVSANAALLPPSIFRDLLERVRLSRSTPLDPRRYSYSSYASFAGGPPVRISRASSSSVASVHSPPLTSVISALADSQELPPNYFVELINADGFILSVAAPNRRSSAASLDSPRDNAVPLFRQNAIRHKRQPHLEHVSTERIAELHLHYSKLLRSISKPRIYRNKIPFSTSLVSFKAPQTITLPFGKNTGNLDKKLAKFLKQRAKQNSSVPRKLVPFAHSDIPAPCNNLKRASAELKESRKKKRKVQTREKMPPQNSTRADTLLGSGLAIEERFVPSTDKDRIMNGFFCSYVSDGASFYIPCVEDSNTPLNMDLRLSRVDFDKKQIHGIILFNERDNACLAIKNMILFLLFLGGSEFLAMKDSQILIQKRLSIICEALDTSAATLTSNDLVDITSSLKIEVSGNILDFKDHDFRFLLKIYPDAKTPSTVHENPLLDVEFELSQWLKIRPFFNFAEAKFYETLVNVDRYLRFAKKLGNNDAINTNFAETLKKRVHEFMETYGFIKDTELPYEHLKSEFRGRDRAHKSGILSSWDKKLAEEFCNMVVTEKKNLINVQLNYVLFTLQLDAFKVMDHLFTDILAHIHDKEQQKFFHEMYSEAGTSDDSAAARKVVFVCSVNRKTGELHIHNTRPMFDYRMMEVLKQCWREYHLPDFRSSAAAILNQSQWGNIKLKDPEAAGVPTNLQGFWRREAGASTASNRDSLCGNYSIA